MLENELKQALKESRPVPPEGFHRRSDQQLRRMTAEEGKNMKKFSTGVLVFALLLILTMIAAIAEGLFPWTRGLEDGLQVTEQIKDVYKETELFDEPQMSVTQNGVTITLDQCIVDTNAAYIAFRVKGYEPELGKQPAFDQISIEVGEPHDQSTGWFAGFFDGMITSPDGTAVYPDGRIPEDYAQLPYANAEGELLYVITMNASDDGAFSYVGKKAHAVLKGLGTYDNRGGVQVAVEGTWEFEWTLKGTDRHLDLTGLSLPIGQTGAMLTGVRLSPIHVKLLMNVPRVPAPEEEDDTNAPYFMGVILKDGTVYTPIANGGGGGYLDAESNDFRAMYGLSRIIEPEQVATLLLYDRNQEEQVEVRLPE